MKRFMDEDFLLQTDTAKTLFHEYAKPMPIADYHCHINPMEIALDKNFESITDMWLSGDHYKWRAMRYCGFKESDIILGLKENPYKVFEAFAKTLPQLIGNPLYHFTYLELKRYFGIDKQLSGDTAKEVYEECNSVIKSQHFSPKSLIKKSNVKFIGTTDDPVDELIYHKKIKEDLSFDTKVYPSFRPDNAMAVDKIGYGDYIKKLENTCGHGITNFEELIKALSARISYFNDLGCRTADHGLYHMVYSEYKQKELNEIFTTALLNPVDEKNADKFKTAVLIELSKEYHKLSWVMQIHFGCLRNLSTKNFNLLGADTGFDAINDLSGAKKLSKLLDKMEIGGHLPKTILYSLNENDNVYLSSIMTSFSSGGECSAKVQLGSAWWFNDTKDGMEKQLKDFARIGSLSNFVGMLTDSRSFLSYTRHEYFRRILSNIIGSWYENGELYQDIYQAGKIIMNISYNNSKNFFNF